MLAIFYVVSLFTKISVNEAIDVTKNVFDNETVNCMGNVDWNNSQTVSTTNIITSSSPWKKKKNGCIDFLYVLTK